MMGIPDGIPFWHSNYLCITPKKMKFSRRVEILDSKNVLKLGEGPVAQWGVWGGVPQNWPK